MTLPLGPLSIVALIFGGCCSNVFALEAIVRNAPSTGLLITFCHFFCSALVSYPTQFSSDGPYTLRKPLVPTRKWAWIAAMHFGINILNNYAFAFNISVPVHIILRSFGSVTTMAAGWIRGKRYSRLQVLSVALLTVGVLIAAWADAQSKGKNTASSSGGWSSDFLNGLAIILTAQLLSAFMGAYVEDVFAEHGASWTENLFYTHFLSLPLFLPLSSTLRQQYGKLSATPHLNVDQLIAERTIIGNYAPRLLQTARPLIDRLPQGQLFLLINTLTQLACISGVNLLSSKTSAVTVTIVLNIRKLVSFVFSTLLFGHQLSLNMIIGSTLVFGGGALYGWETSWRLPRERNRTKAANGKAVGNGTIGKKAQ